MEDLLREKMWAILARSDGISRATEIPGGQLANKILDRLVFQPSPGGIGTLLTLRGGFAGTSIGARHELAV